MLVVSRRSKVTVRSTKAVIVSQSVERLTGQIIVPHRIIRSWYTGRWWVGCYIWYSDEATGRGPSCQPAQAPPRCIQCNSPPITASVPITYHSLNGSSDSVNGDLQLLWELANLNPPQKWYSWTDQQRSRHNWLRPREDPLYQIWYKSTRWGLLGKWAKYNKKLFFIYTFFLRFAYRSDPWMDFYARQLKRREITQGCAFWGSERCFPKFWG